MLLSTFLVSRSSIIPFGNQFLRIQIRLTLLFTDMHMLTCSWIQTHTYTHTRARIQTIWIHYVVGHMTTSEPLSSSQIPYRFFPKTNSTNNTEEQMSWKSFFSRRFFSFKSTDQAFGYGGLYVEGMVYRKSCDLMASVTKLATRSTKNADNVLSLKKLINNDANFFCRSK